MMSGLSAYLSAFLEWQILSINVLGIIRIIWNWTREREKLEVEDISNLPIQQYKYVNGKDSWYKTILLLITNVRFVIDRVTIFACASNIVTIFARRWWNLLILWMLLSFIQDIVLEVVIIAVMSLLWYEGNVPTLKFVEFIVEKLFWIVAWSYKWCTILKWYTQLRKAEKLRKFAIIARRSIADISQVPGRIGHSLDDELLATAETRRGRYASTASLLNLDSLSVGSDKADFELRISKSLSTKISDNSRESSRSNDCDSIANDLSTAEKSMKMLRITAEDVMDARARIQERWSSHWSDGNVSEKTSEAIEELMAEIVLEKEKDEINVNKFVKAEQVVTDSRKEATESASRREVKGNLTRDSLTEEEREKDDGEKPLVEREKKDINSGEKRAKGDIKSQDAVSQRKKIENSGVAENFVQCSSSKSGRNMNFQSLTSLAKKMEAKSNAMPASHGKRIDSDDQREHPRDEVKTTTRRLAPTDSSTDKKERYKGERVSSCEFHRAVYTNSTGNGSSVRSAADDANDDNVGGKEAKRFVSSANAAQIEKLNGHNSRLNYSEIYRLKKQIQKSNEPCGKQPVTYWGSKSLAQTARPSGYARNFVAADRSRFICQNAQTEIFDESSEFLRARSKLKQIGRIEKKRSVELRSAYNVISGKRKDYAKSEEREAELLTSDHNRALLLKDEKNTKARKRRALSPQTLPTEEREAIERTTLRAYNELTLLEDKKRLEARREGDLSSNCEQSTRELNVRTAKRACEDFTLPQDKREIETIREHNSCLLSCARSDEESIVSKLRDELTSLGDKKDHEAPLNCEEKVEVPIRAVPNHFPGSNREEIVNCPPAETRENSFEENDRPARRNRLNLREITRNIEWTVHPEGVVLTNKNLRSQFSNEGLRERQRDIVDDNTASMLHSAFFFKPEIVTRIFRQSAQSTTNESFSAIALRRQDFNTDFACRVNNEVIVRDRNTLFGYGLERMMERSDDLGCSLFSNVNIYDDSVDNNRVAREESSRNSYAMSVELEQMVSESADWENSAVELQEDILTASSLVKPEEVREEETAVIDNSSFQCVADILRNIDIEENILACTLSSEQFEDRGRNVIVDCDFRPEQFSINNTIFADENDNKRDRGLLDESANIDEIIDDLSKQNLNSSNDCLDNNTLSVNSMEENPHTSQGGKYLSSTNIYSKNKVYGNNLFLKSADNNSASQLSDNNNNNDGVPDTMINKAETIMFHYNLENSSKLSFPGLSFIKSDNCHASIVRSSNERLPKLTRFSGSEAMTENPRRRSIHSGANNDTTSQFRTFANVKFIKIETQDIARNENKITNICETASKVPTTGFLEMNSEQLRQDDSFYSTYDRDNKSEILISLEESSLMEEFSDDIILPAMSSFSQTSNSATQSQNIFSSFP